MRRPTGNDGAALFLCSSVSRGRERVRLRSGSGSCRSFRGGLLCRSFFRRGLEILLVQLHADAVALPHDDCRACTGHADDGGSARMLGSLSMVASRYWASTVTVLPLATLPAGMVKLSWL